MAYLTVKEGDAPKEPELRRLLQASLPDYMIPSAFVTLDEFPLTPNKKVDRGALPSPNFESNTDEFVPPASPLEKELANIWGEILRVKQVGLRDNFFDLGGHSLMAVRLIDKINRTFQITLGIAELFQHPTVEGMAASIRELSSKAPASRSKYPNGFVELKAGTTGRPPVIEPVQPAPSEPGLRPPHAAYRRAWLSRWVVPHMIEGARTIR